MVPASMIWLGLAVFGIGTVILLSFVIWNMPANPTSGVGGGAIVALIGKLIVAVGLFSMGMTRTMHPAVRCGGLIAAAIIVAGTGGNVS